MTTTWDPTTHEAIAIRTTRDGAIHGCDDIAQQHGVFGCLSVWAHQLPSGLWHALAEYPHHQEQR